MRSTLLVTFLLISLIPSFAGEPDPWIGKSRADLVTMLGEPNKTKSSKAGETLTYKLARLEEGVLPPMGMSVIKVPGVAGGVGVTPRGAKIQVEDNAPLIDPQDEYGRGSGGRVDTSESHSVSWSKKDGVERSWDDQRTVRGRLTLKFTVDAAGKIVDWSVSPRKAAEPR